MSNPKVFEFAKEIGMTPLALMDKIREWQLPVKSHMAELEPAVLETIKQKLSGGNSSDADSKSAEKKISVRKAPARKKVEAPANAKVAETPAQVAKTASTTVVRRKKADSDSGGADQSSSEAAELKSTSIVEENTVVQAAPQPVVPTVEKVAVNKEPAPVVAAAVTAPVNKEPAHVAPQQVTPMKEEITAVSAAPAAPVKSDEPSAGAAAAAAAGAHRKKEVIIGASGVASSAPKRNIVGRMDLSRVSSLPGNQQSRGPQDRGNYQSGPRGSGFSNNQNTGSGGGFGGNQQNRPKGNLRAGFIQAPQIVPEIVEESLFDKKKDDRRRSAKGGGTEGGPSARVNEEEVVKHFDAAEFRKREMVFQPKKKKGLLSRPAMQTQITTPKASKRVVKVNQTMKLSDLANEMGVKGTDLIKNLMKNGVMANLNMELDFDTIALTVGEFGFEAENVYKTAEEIITDTAFGELEAEKVVRPPVVTIMGHVDHGKTSLLDAIRNARVAAGEAGGITQHIGAYQVTTDSGHVVTFLDTPGHEAFTAMRARGANVTDIAVIVVAADDGVMPQTAEAINHAKAAGVPMIVAVNKMDKPGANPDRIKQQLTEYSVVPEEWGGDTIFVPVSALKKTGLEELLEQIHLLAEMKELRANPKRSATGIVIESKLEKGRGSVATVLIQDGTAEVGQYVVAGAVTGRIRSLTNDKGQKIQTAGPGQPVELLGLDNVPAAGDRFDVVISEKVAEQVAAQRQEIIEKAKQPQTKLSLEDVFSKVKQGDVKELSIVLKSDVAGSLEAIQGMFAKMAAQEVKIKIIHAAVGGISETDVLLAGTAKGIVVGFNVRPDGGAIAKSKQMGVEIRTYTIVYELMDEIKKAMSGLLDPDIVEKSVGRAEVRNTFNVPKMGTIAGCFVVDGKIQRSNLVRLVRDGRVIYEGKIGSLRRFKDDAKEVAQGFECGVGIENFNDVKTGDVLEFFIKEEIQKELTMINA